MPPAANLPCRFSGRELSSSGPYAAFLFKSLRSLRLVSLLEKESGRGVVLLPLLTHLSDTSTFFSSCSKIQTSESLVQFTQGLVPEHRTFRSRHWRHLGRHGSAHARKRDTELNRSIGRHGGHSRWGLSLRP